jgi:hypothetical protein
MRTLKFDAPDVRRVVEHSIVAKTQGKSARASAPPAVPAVLLVRDRGIYLMSNGEPRDLVEGQRSFVAYATGCDPFRDPDWRDRCRDLAGDDDFSLTLPWAENLKVLIDAGAQTIAIDIDRDGDGIEVSIASDA